jgi:hypothetical protein
LMATPDASSGSEGVGLSPSVGHASGGGPDSTGMDMDAGDDDNAVVAASGTDDGRIGEASFRFPAALFLDAMCFKWLGMRMPRRSSEIPLVCCTTCILAACADPPMNNCDTLICQGRKSCPSSARVMRYWKRRQYTFTRYINGCQ